MRVPCRKLNWVVEIVHSSVEFVAQGGDISGPAGFAARGGCFDNGLTLPDQSADICEGLPSFGLDVEVDSNIQRGHTVFVGNPPCS